MNSASKTYLMILPVRYHRIDGQTVMLESAFAEHLRLLKAKLSSVFNRLIIAMVEMSPEDYEKDKQRLIAINEQEEGIFFKPLYKSEDVSSRLKRLIQLLKIFQISGQLKELVNSCDVLHTGMGIPIELVATLWGIFLKKSIVYVVDIDFRNSAQMNYKTGTWSLKSYLLCKYVYDKIREIQISFAVATCSLVLLKGKKLVQDFGKGKPGVKNFLDAAYSEQHIIDHNAFDQKLLHLTDQNRPLEVVYFGRLTSYKGVDLCIRAIAMAYQKTGCNVRFHILGNGEEEENLKKLTQELGIGERVIFYGALPFNLDFFKKLYTYHLLLAAPLSEDTPRSALDAMASGIPILAFDTYYYQDLTSTGAVDTVSWLSVDQLAEKVARYEKNRELLAEMSRKAVDFARHNTQEIWLDRRIDWTLTYGGLR